MNLINTTHSTVLGTPHYIAPEVLLEAGWTADEMWAASAVENNKSCKKCGVKIYRHKPSNFGSLACPKKEARVVEWI